MSTAVEGRTALYRFYDEQNVLLYVGITGNLTKRFAVHRFLKSWWPQVARHSVEWMDDREAAKLAERQAIKDEAPLWNINHSPWHAVLMEHGGRMAVLRPRRGLVAPTPADHTKPRQFRVAEPIWEAYQRVCARLGTTRAQDLNTHMFDMIREHGDEQDHAALKQGEKELAERRSRMHPGRPRRTRSERP